MQMQDQAQMFEARLARKSGELAFKSDETFKTAVGILDDSVMRIGKEMDSATLEAKTFLKNLREKTQMIKRLQKRLMTEIRLELQALKQELIKEVEANLRQLRHDKIGSSMAGCWG
jgi:hypothetical protein